MVRRDTDWMGSGKNFGFGLHNLGPPLRITNIRSGISIHNHIPGFQTIKKSFPAPCSTPHSSSKRASRLSFTSLIISPLKPVSPSNWSTTIAPASFNGGEVSWSRIDTASSHLFRRIRTVSVAVPCYILKQIFLYVHPTSSHIVGNGQQNSQTRNRVEKSGPEGQT